MARFIAVHRTPEGGSQEQLTAAAKQILASLAPGAKWLNSWWVEGDVRKMFCEWEAEDEDAIRASLAPVTDYFPTEAIYLVTWIDPDWFA